MRERAAELAADGSPRVSVHGTAPTLSPLAAAHVRGQPVCFSKIAAPMMARAMQRAMTKDLWRHERSSSGRALSRR